MSNVYEKCPVLENEKWMIRFIEEKDAADLARVYGDVHALPFFNSDNCHGDNFYYETEQRVLDAIKGWRYVYGNGDFVRFSIVNKSEGTVIGTIELFNRKAQDYFNDCGLLRLDIGSAYEKEEVIKEVLELMVPSTYSLFECSIIATKAPLYAVERVKALEALGFTKSKECLRGQYQEYYDYWVIEK